MPRQSEHFLARLQHQMGIPLCLAFLAMEEGSSERNILRGRISLCEGNHEEIGIPYAAMGEVHWWLQAENPKT